MEYFNAIWKHGEPAALITAANAEAADAKHFLRICKKNALTMMTVSTYLTAAFGQGREP